MVNIMSKNIKDFMEQFTDLDDDSVEEIAENYPALEENQKRRILKKCLEKSNLSCENIQITENNDFIEENDEVSGIEHYDKPIWRKYMSSVATLIVAIVGITSVIVLRGNINDNDDFDVSTPPIISETSENSQVTIIVTGSYIDNGYNANGFDYAGQNDYSGIIVGGTTTAPVTTVQPGHVVAEGENIYNHDSQNDQQVPVAESPEIVQTTTVPETTPVITEPQTTTAETIPVESETAETTVSNITEPVPEPNKYGFYEIENPANSSISVASLIGSWEQTDNISDILTVYEGDNLYDGTWHMAFQNGEVKTGYIKFQYSVNGEIKLYWFNFYTDEKELWQSFKASGEIPFDSLYLDNAEKPYFLRIQDKQPYNEEIF